jgi:dTDP-4-amino-4,6-dideoxygalactose transaminase
MTAPLQVFRPDLPPLDDLMPALQALWDSRLLTNNGPFVQRLEGELAEFLGVPAVLLFCNGTQALLAALRALDLGEGGEVLTTPFSFVASAHVLRWAGLTPVFVDVEPETFTLDPARLAAALTPRTRAILPVHVYGHPCDSAAIDVFAERHGLRVLYDAAHAFGVRCAARPLWPAGALSVLSFHATKVFHTLEGGAVIVHEPALAQRLAQIRNFGFVDELTVDQLGINGKMNELQAAIGSLQLPRFAANTARRAAVDAAYRRALAGRPGLQLPPLPVGPPGDAHNFGYFALRVQAGFGETRDALCDRLRSLGIVARRYFHPLISEFPMYREMPGADPANLPVATRLAREVLCLPLHAGLDDADVRRVVRAVLDGRG